ncbi:MAG: transcription-repair coupling factor, partial [Nitrospirae bacterium]|nr:transcription-repair coupling factor [Nitrospirota bacterium]
YRSQEGVSPVIDKMGGSSWLKVKNKVKAKVKDIAYKLIKLYAEREISEGFAFSTDTEVHREFDDFFPYEPTPDQIKSISEIKDDMESVRPMDRLLCGDVGYGKTEVAMRAVFKAIYDGKQAVVLTPTTLLCEQHYMTFKERFSAFPTKIDFISRFRTRKEINDILKRLSDGEVDIVIGTHGLLKKDLDIKNLGILIVDEEHKFGVAQKTRIKEIKKGVDCLSLSATPIPRTLQMALSGIWNMSTIETPPEDRLSIRTFISVFNEDLIKEAIKREKQRSGQVFFIHNRIKDIDRIAVIVKRLVPDATVAIAHGQMNEKELEDIMLNFMRGNTDVLVSTTIISSGLDIPRSNTIIINRADMIGLADLYQLRGRVGRSDLRAYAYFLVPSEDMMTEKAKKRLAAIQELSYLGAGLRLAMKDMEIRGAGNLIGAEQSGHIDAVGFDTYMEMLEEEIAIQRGTPQKTKIETVIDLRVNAILPDDYIEDVSLRLSFYRRIASAGSLEDLYNLKDEMKDRFGRLPISVENLFGIMLLKTIATTLQIAKIEQFKKKVIVKFLVKDGVIFDNVLGLKDKVKHKMRFLPDGFEVLTDGIKEEEIISVMIGVVELCKE